MDGIRIIPHATMSNDKIKGLVKAIHRPKNYVFRYNLNLCEKFEEGNLKFKDLIKRNTYRHRKNTDLVCIQNNFVFEIEINNKDIEFRILYDKLEQIKEDYRRYIPRINFDKEVKDYKVDLKGCEVVEMQLSEHFMFALKSSFTGQEPLRYILDLKRSLKDGEKVIYQVILHSSDEEWQNVYRKKFDELRRGKYPVKNVVSVKNVIKMVGNGATACVLEGVYIMEEILMGANNVTKIDLKEDDAERLKKNRMITMETRNKGSELGFEVAIRGFIYGDSEMRREELKRHFKGCFSCMDGNNRLLMKEIKLKGADRDRVLNRELLWKPLTSTPNILNVDEVSKLIQLPQVTLQKEYKMRQTSLAIVDIPAMLFEGKIPLGHIYGGGNLPIGTWGLKTDLLCASKVIVGPKGCGKSYYLENYVYGAYQMGHSVFYFDYIENCLNAKNIAKFIPKKDVTIIDLSEGFTMDFPEITLKKFDLSKPKEVRKYNAKASDYGNIITEMVDKINLEDTEALSGNMRNILMTASTLCFYAKRFALKDVFKFLSNHTYRMEIVDIVKAINLLEEDDYRYIQVEAINLYDRDGVLEGTKGTDKVLVRFNALLRDSRTAEMLQGINENIFNFVEMMEQNKVFLFLIPEGYFTSYRIKDIVMTYFLTRLKLAATFRAELIPVRDDRKIVHIILDEIHQLENSPVMMEKNVAEDRKFRTTYVITCQFLGQFSRKLFEAIKGSGSNFMFIAGTEKANFSLFKEEIGDKFQLEELLNMDERHSLNIVKIDSSKCLPYITKLPNMLEDRIKNKEV